MREDDEDIIGRTRFLYKGLWTDILLYRPKKKWNTSDEFSCRIAIIGPEINYTDEFVGYDSMQAIFISGSMIGIYLRENEKIDKNLIEWPGGVLKLTDFGA